MSEMSPEAAKAVELVQKLLNLANKNTNEAEAASAMQRAQKLMEDYNLDMAKVERASGDTGKREKASNEGGLYHWQRDLWRAVAELNFCVYWTATETTKRRKVDKYGYIHERRGYKFVHMLVGRTVNVTSTRVMAQYLEGAIERLTRERLNNDGKEFFTNWAMSYREGIAERVLKKVYLRRRERLAEERRKEADALAKAAQAGMAGASTSTALALQGFIEQEKDANYDFMHGEGASARKREREAKRAENLRKEQEEYTRWAAANPEEARRAEAKAERDAERAANRRTSWDRKNDKRDWSAYHAGYNKGEEVSIDQQAGRNKTAGLLK